MSAKHNRPTSKKTDEDSWGLNAPIRFPVNGSSWRSFDPSVLSKGPARNISPHTYADTLGRPSIEETITVALLLSKTFPSDFSLAANSLSPVMWRWLFYRVDCCLAQMTSVRFHPDILLRQACDQRDEFNEPPREWIGGNEDLDQIIESGSLLLRQLGVGPANAIWTVLAVAQRVPLGKSEVLRCEWWTPGWLQSFAMSYRNTE